MIINLKRIRTVLDDREEEIRKENDAFVDEINNELAEEDITLVECEDNAPCNIFFVETGGTEPLFLKEVENIDKDEPLILLSNCRNNSLPATLEIKTYCSRNKISNVMCVGRESNSVASTLKAFLRVYLAKKSLDDNNLGVIGVPSPWLISSVLSKEEVKEKLNMNLVDIPMEELVEEINKHQMVDHVPHYEELKKKFKKQDVLEEALYIYSALKRLVKKYDLKGLTIRCFDLLEKYHNTSCLALGLLNEEGITSGCEGDICSLITMHMLKALTNRPTFMANPSYIDPEKREILFAHCTLPLNMTTSYKLLTHFESNEGIGIKGEMPTGEISICKLALTKKGFFEDSLAIEGTIKENASLPGYCRTQIIVEISETDLVSFYKNDFANHCIIAYGNVVDDFIGLLSFYQVKFEKNSKN